MPYLPEQHKRYYKDLLDQIHLHAITEPGELNYLITELCLQAMKDKTVNYTLLNGIVGALDCAKEEFRRRVLNPYEQEKIKSNGDVYL